MFRSDTTLTTQIVSRRVYHRMCLPQSLLAAAFYSCTGTSGVMSESCTWPKWRFSGVQVSKARLSAGASRSPAIMMLKCKPVAPRLVSYLPSQSGIGRKENRDIEDSGNIRGWSWGTLPRWVILLNRRDLAFNIVLFPLNNKGLLGVQW